MCQYGLQRTLAVLSQYDQPRPKEISPTGKLDSEECSIEYGSQTLNHYVVS